ncbi:MAG: hypothetical protein U9Q85_03215 [Patescibacteria group bacterium]|nr:hypothetical protein [Patescibacteria group bacterium]
MKYIDFYNNFKKFPIITLADIRSLAQNFDRRRLSEWQERGYIRKLANNFYIFSDKEINENNLNIIANKLYQPSYLSLEYALSYYSLIPETVYWLTSVSTRKTNKIEIDIANFSYRKIKKNLFFGYTLKRINNNDVYFKIAEPEKAILDFLYLRKDIKDKDSISELRISGSIFREKININKLKKYLKIFGSKTMNKKVEILNSIL